MVYVVLSPAKTLDFKLRRTGVQTTIPFFQSRADNLVETLKKMSPAQIADLMKLSPKLAQLNVDRFQAFTSIKDASLPNEMSEQFAAAILAYRGDTYQGLNAIDLSDKDLQWAQNHIGILTGLYGVLRPLDVIQPYRLEMGTRLATAEAKNLYEFWNTDITRHVEKHITEHKLQAVIGCASNEYLDALNVGALSVPFIQCDFKEKKKDGSLGIVGLFAKRARGMMARYVIEHRITSPEKIQSFNSGGYHFEPALSTDERFVYVR